MATRASPLGGVNNEVYDGLHERWYDADDDPIALLRAESRLRNPWIARELARTFRSRKASVLDVGCGAGFLANYLAAAGHWVVGLDASQGSLDVAAAHDATRSVRYRLGDALALPYDDGVFDAVCAMDFLEHVEEPERVIAEASRVLAPGGLFFFHTFNRNWLSGLVVIKGVEWFVKNTPRDLHVLRLFLKPSEVLAMCHRHGLGQGAIHGSRPVVGSAFAKMLFTGRVSGDFRFTFTPSTRIGFTGFTRRTNERKP